MDVYQRASYTQRIYRGAVLNKYKAVMLEYKQLAKDLAGDKWNFSDLKGLSTDYFWTWLESDGLGYEVDAYLGLYN